MLQRGEVVRAGGGDVQSCLQAGAVVELARVAIRLLPCPGRVREAFQHGDPGTGVLEPAPQPGPSGEQCLVGDPDILGPGHHQPPLGEHGQCRGRGRIVGPDQIRPPDPPPDPGAVLVHG